MTTSHINTLPGPAPATLVAIDLRHPETDRVARAPLGFSVPVLLLGPVPLMARGDWGLALKVAAACVLLPVVGQVFMATCANKLYVMSLLNRGYRVLRSRPGVVSSAEWILGMNLPRF